MKEKTLYAFSIKPNATTIDIEAEGFENADITRATPEIPFTYTIMPFIHQWISFGVDPGTGLEFGRYERMYGPPVAYSKSIRKTEGLKNLGYLHTRLQCQVEKSGMTRTKFSTRFHLVQKT